VRIAVTESPHACSASPEYAEALNAAAVRADRRLIVSELKCDA
jgi:hypothetical protein